jgi:hypothetical protein
MMWAGSEVMTYRGTVHGDVIVLEDGVRLPNGLAVLVEPVAVAAEARPDQAEPAILRNGVPVFPRQEGATSVVDLEMVNRLRDDTP